MKTFRHICALFLVTVLAATAVPVAAQTGTAAERITLSPAVSKPSLAAGATHNDILKVINDGTIDYTFKVYSAPFSVKDEAYDPDFVTIKERTRAFEWVSFEKDSYTLAAGEQIEVPYTITVPSTAAPGGHYAVIFVETQPKSNSQIARKKRVGNLLYVTISGDVHEEGRLTGVSVPWLHSKPPVVTDIRVENTGNVHFDAKATTVYQGLLGRKYLTYNQEVIIMPGTTRRIPMTWEKPPYLGIFRVTSSVDYLGKSESLPTKYVIILPLPVRIVAGVLLLTLIALLVRRKFSRGNNGAGRPLQKI